MTKNRVLKFAAVMFGAVITLAAAAPAMAQQGTFTVKQSVEIPRGVLAPGTYVFKQISSDVIEVSDIEGHNISLFLTAPNSHDRREDCTEITVKEHRVSSIHFAESDRDMRVLYPASSESAKDKTAVLPMVSRHS